MAKKQQTVHQIKILGLNDIKALNVEIGKLADNYEGLKDAANDAKEPLKDTGKGAGGAGKGIDKLAKGAAAAGIALVAFNKVSKALTAQLKKGVEVFKGYEFAMAKVKAISGANTEEFIKLDKSAQALGRSTFFTAEQVANLQLNFSKLGFTSSEVLNVQEAALLAATATGEDLARTATVIGSTIRGFGLDASEGARVSDVMAASFTSSALTLEKFQTSMTKVSPVAKLLGMDLEETTSIMGVLTDAGIEASIAGTSLRNIFLKLGDPSSDLAKSIGFTVNSGEDMVREFRRMRDEGVNVEKMLKVVDVRQVAAISTMIEHIDKIENQTEAFRNSAGAAGDMADIIGDSLQGATLRFQSALDGLRIVIVESFAPALQSTLDTLAKFFNLIAKNKATTMSENLEMERHKMNALFEITQDENAELSTRRKAINQLNKDYKEYLPNLISEKDTFVDLAKAQALTNEQMTNRITLMAAEELLVDAVQEQLTREKDLFELTKKRNELQAQITRGEAEIHQGKQRTINLTQNELDRTINQIKALKEKGEGEQDNIDFLLEKATELGSKLKIVNGQIVNLGQGGKDDGNGNGDNGTPAGDDLATKTVKEAELKLQAAILDAKKEFFASEVETKEEFSLRLLEIEIEHLQKTFDLLQDGSEQKFEIDKKLTDARIKLKQQETNSFLKSEEDKRKATEDNIKTMKETGKLLMQIGEQQGENSKITAAGIKITQAAAIADGIHGLINAEVGIAEQAKLPFPSNLIAMAATAAQVVSVIANIKSFIGGGGGGGSSDGEATFLQDSQGNQFANGGLTTGGMFVGNSHANGGVKFRVGGRIHEAEGGEAIINKKSTSMFRPMLSAINSYNGNGVKFADGGLLNSGEKFAMGGELRSAQQLVSGGVGSSKVVIVESDMTEVQNRISAIESQATF